MEALVESEAPASSDTDLVFMTCLMQLAVGARKMLRERKYHFPEVSSDLLKTFYPILSSFILEVQLREPNETDGRAIILRCLSLIVLLLLLLVANVFRACCRTCCPCICRPLCMITANFT